MVPQIVIVILVVATGGSVLVLAWNRRVNRAAETAHRRQADQVKRMHANREFAEIDYAIGDLERQISELRNAPGLDPDPRLSRLEELRHQLGATRSTLGGHRLTLEPLVAEVIEESRVRAGDREIVFVRDGSAGKVEIEGDPAALRWAVQELIGNTVVHGGNWSRIEVRLDAIPGGVELSVVDDGQGPDMLTAARLFAPFTPRKESTGPGLGLYTVRCIVERHEGSIAARAGSRGGLEHTLRLPEPGGSFVPRQKVAATRLTG